MNIVVFGCGTYGKKTIQYIEKYSDRTGDRIICLADNDDRLWGRTLGGYEIIKADRLPEMDPDLIIITPVIYRSDIRHQLCSLGIAEEKCLFIPDYESMVLIKSEYIRRYGGLENNSNNNALKASSIVVYTGIFGDYDDLKKPGYTGEGVDYVCFTNQPGITSDIWDVRYVETSCLDDNMLEKLYKFFPERFLPEYEISVWVDGKIRIKNDLRTYIDIYGRDKSMLCFPHYARKCVYDEAFACMTLHPGIKNQLLDQITAYHLEEYPIDNGLYELSCIVRRHNDKELQRIMEEWMQEIKLHSRRDQISFPYVCQKNGFLPDISDLDVRMNYWFERCNHKK